MALDNATVLANLKTQLEEVTKQINTAEITRFKLTGAIDVLEQIEESNKVETSPLTDEVVDEEEVERN
tara:strand:+ start:553 stop:756 length:204 start_codon:yes stop_codon:yes gene_type:complete